MAAQILDEDSLSGWLRARSLVPADAELAITHAGDGNINWVRRVSIAGGGSLIVKQARPALEKFPEYQADTRRIVTEYDWLQLAAPLDEENVCPRVLSFDEADRVLVLEDLGDAARLDAALLGTSDLEQELASVGALLGAVHRTTWDDADMAQRFAATEMRDLHFAHIYELPFAENDFPLPAAVAERALRLHKDDAILAEIAAARQEAREHRRCVQHADPQPGNILLTAGGPKLLDAEIAHFGAPAFDPGNLLGHLGLTALPERRTRLLRERAGAWWGGYREAIGADRAPEFAAIARHAAVEMLRRTVGAARVAAVAADEDSLAAIETACGWLREPPATPQDLCLREGTP